MAAPSAGQLTERVSLHSSGAQANYPSETAVVSASGRYVAFTSGASNLVAGDTNGDTDVFVHDRQTGTTERVSVSSAGAQGNFQSIGHSISADGRYVAFASFATNLVANDTNGMADVFVRDRQNGTTERISVSSTGVEGNQPSDSPSLSADGRYVAFTSGATNFASGTTSLLRDVFVRDRQTGTTEWVSPDPQGEEVDVDCRTWDGAISDDGRYVAFTSDSPDLVAGDTNFARDVFVRDRQSGTTERASVASGGLQGNSHSQLAAISADGRCVAFESLASNLVSGDTNNAVDIFVHDRESGTTERVSVSSAGAQVSSDSFSASISADGRRVAFASTAFNLVEGDTNGTHDLFVRDRQAGTTERVNVSSAGEEANDSSNFGSISADGAHVGFATRASNLVSHDTNFWSDVFVRDLCVDATAAAFAGDGVNADVIAPVSALLGSSWSAPLTIGHPHGAGGPLSLKVRSVAINGPTIVSPIGGRPTEVLVAGPVLAILSGAHDGSTGDIPPQAIPAGDSSLVGVSFAAQYVVLGGGFADYSQAVTGTIGCD